MKLEEVFESEYKDILSESIIGHSKQVSQDDIIRNADSPFDIDKIKIMEFVYQNGEQTENRYGMNGQSWRSEYDLTFASLYPTLEQLDDLRIEYETNDDGECENCPYYYDCLIIPIIPNSVLDLRKGYTSLMVGIGNWETNQVEYRIDWDDLDEENQKMIWDALELEDEEE